MLKRLSMILSVVAALGLGLALVAPTPVDAKPQNQNQNKNVQVKKNFNNNVQVKKSFKSNKFVVGKSYNGHMWYGRSRHRWHGAWYAYGVGPCWINVDGLWFWNVAACP